MTTQQPDVIACDMHPGYATTAWARRHAVGRDPHLQRTYRLAHATGTGPGT
jgi:hydrogenase maturation protein HypF